MNKDEILAKSRAENKNKDVYEREVLKRAAGSALIVQAILAAAFFLVQILTSGGVNWGLWALVFSANMTTFWVKYRLLRRRHELLAAIAYTALVAILSAYYVYGLIASSAIL